MYNTVTIVQTHTGITIFMRAKIHISEKFNNGGE